MIKSIVWRNDDISVSTDVAVLKPIHDHFKEAIVMHTVAVIAKDLYKNKELISYLKKENFDIQLHCWEHVNLDENKDKLAAHIALSLDMFDSCGFSKPTVLYPPWNLSSNAVACIAAEFGLEVSNKKCSLDYYVKHNGNVEFDTVNFHYWDKEVIDLPEALRIYNTKR